MPTKKKTAAKAKTTVNKHAPAKKADSPPEAAQPPAKAASPVQTVEVPASVPATSSYVPRLDQKDERSEEEKAIDLEKAKEEKAKAEEVKIKTPPSPREVPHIDIPVIEDKEELAHPAWHTANEDLPSFAKPTNVPAPIPPSQSLTSAPPPGAEPVAKAPPAPVRELQDKVNVVPISEEYLPVEAMPAPAQPKVPKTKPEPIHHDIEVNHTMPDPVSMFPVKPHKKNSILFFLVGIAVGVLVLLASVWGYVFASKRIVLPFGGKQAAAPTPTQTPAPTPTPAFDRSGIMLEVLNGSGVKGAAADAAEKMKSKGYTIVSTGNADAIVPVTQLFLRDEVRKNESEILADVADLFPEATDAGELTGPTTATARLVVGKE